MSQFVRVLSAVIHVGSQASILLCAAVRMVWSVFQDVVKELSVMDCKGAGTENNCFPAKSQSIALRASSEDLFSDQRVKR